MFDQSTAFKYVAQHMVVTCTTENGLTKAHRTSGLAGQRLPRAQNNCLKTVKISWER